MGVRGKIPVRLKGMPYKRKTELPKQVKDNLPPKAQDIYRKAYNSAEEQYADPSKRKKGGSREETASRVAWSAVKSKYQKDEESGEWKQK